MNYYLIDLERSIGSGSVHYWKGNRHGYTRDIKEAGLFPESLAQATVEQDFDKRTVMVSEKTVQDIL